MATALEPRTIGTSTTAGVVYGGSGDQSVCGGSYGANLSTSGSGTKTLDGPVTVTGRAPSRSWAGTTLNQGTTTLTTGAGGMTIASGGTFQDTGSGALTLNGNVANSGTFSVDGNGGGCKTTDAKATINGTGTLSGGALSGCPMSPLPALSPALASRHMMPVGELVPTYPAGITPAPTRPRQCAWSASRLRLTATACCSDGTRPWKPTISASACTARPAMPPRRSRPI